MTSTCFQKTCELAFTDLEIGVYGVHRTHGGQYGGARLAHEITRIHEMAADEPVDGRLDGGVTELDLGVLELGTGGE